MKLTFRCFVRLKTNLGIGRSKRTNPKHKSREIREKSLLRADRVWRTDLTKLKTRSRRIHLCTILSQGMMKAKACWIFSNSLFSFNVSFVSPRKQTTKLKVGEAGSLLTDAAPTLSFLLCSPRVFETNPQRQSLRIYT